MTKFEDVKHGDCFIAEDDGIYMKVFGHNLSNIVNEGTGGHAVLLTEGLLCYFNDWDKVETLNIDMKLDLKE